MKKLTEIKYWDTKYKNQTFLKNQYVTENDHKVLIKKLIGKKLLEYTKSYADYLLWEVIYREYIPTINKGKVLEIGSAPGKFLLRFSRTFGFIPFGIEYSNTGVELNRKLFIFHNIDPNNVIHADFFSNELHKQYNGYFDIVISRGFIEHFTDVDNIIERHINLLKNGGLLIVSIPNLNGVNYLLTKILHKEVLSKHNLNIMDKIKFSEIFYKRCLTTLFCDYYGTFNSTILDVKRNSPMRYVLNSIHKLQRMMNVTFHLLFGDKGAESRLFSPYLLFIGKKN